MIHWTWLIPAIILAAAAGFWLCAILSSGRDPKDDEITVCSQDNPPV